MTDVLCKFKCESVTHNVNGGQVKLTPVTSGSEENETFFKWTPFGEFTMGTINQGSMGLFVPGKEYYITISEEKE